MSKDDYDYDVAYEGRRSRSNKMKTLRGMLDGMPQGGLVFCRMPPQDEEAEHAGR